MSKANELSQLGQGLVVDTNGDITAIAIDNYLNSYVTNNSIATQTYVNTAITNLVDSAPTTLDTLNELAAALGDDPNFATTVTNSLATKASVDDATALAIALG